MALTSAQHLTFKLEQAHRRAAELLKGEIPSSVRPDEADDRAVAAALAEHVELRLPRLADTFGLSLVETDIVVFLLAAECDSSFRLLMRTQQRELGRPCLEIGTIADLLGLTLREMSECKPLFAPRGPLRRWGIVEYDEVANEGIPLVSQKLRLAPRVASYLLGEDVLPDGIALLTGDVWPPQDLAPQALVERVQRALDSSEPLVVELAGRSQSECQALIQRLGYSLARPIVTLEVASIEPEQIGHRLAELSREARLAAAMPALLGWDTIATPPQPQSTQSEQNVSPSSAKRTLPPSLTRWMRDHDGILFLVADDHEPLLARHAPAIITADVPFPSPLKRTRLMEKALADRGFQVAPEVDLPSVMRRFAVDTDLIKMAARAVEEVVTARDPITNIVLHNELVEACQRQVSHDLKSVAERVQHSHQWKDLVIPVEVYHSLEEMIAYIRHAPKVYDEWGFGGRHSLGQGVSALFAGPPGTGKTMCASVMANELDMELFRVDLSRVVSKWIGETEKNLSKVFDEAAHSNAIILFDEADSLFAKRTEVKSSVDRYANLEVNFLLQRMEAFGGVTILTTNFEDTIDTAFKRRLTFKMRFERPDAEARSALWSKMFPASCAIDDDVDFAKLGGMYELSGGNIRNAAVRAAFLAAAADTPVTMALCRQAVEREAREMGVLVHSQSAPIDEPEHEPASAAHPTATDRSDSGKPSPRLVPITRPRR